MDVIAESLIRFAPHTLLVILLAASPITAVAQRAIRPASEPVDISQGILERLKKQAASDKSLNEENRGEILKLCDEALNALSAAKKFSSQATHYKQDQDSVPRLIKTLQEQLLSSSAVQEVAVPDSATAEDVEELLRQTSAELAARREAVQAIKKATSQRNTRGTEIGRRAAVLDQQIFELNFSIESARETISEPLLKEATLASLTAQRLAAQEEIRALNEELANLNLRRPIRILREQRAERRVAEAIRQTNYLEKTLQSKVDAEMQENLSRLRRETAEALEKHPTLCARRMEKLRGQWRWRGKSIRL
jgi:hypothetical protein